jgi:hypothetical protein
MKSKSEGKGAANVSSIAKCFNRIRNIKQSKVSNSFRCGKKKNFGNIIRRISVNILDQELENTKKYK